MDNPLKYFILSILKSFSSMLYLIKLFSHLSTDKNLLELCNKTIEMITAMYNFWNDLLKKQEVSK